VSISILVLAPPLLERLVPKLLTQSRALTFGIAVCFAAMALSLNVVMRYAGRLSLGHGALAGIGAFASGMLTSRGPEFPFIAGLIGAAIAGSIAGALMGLAARRLQGIWFVLTSLGFAVAMEQSVFRWRALTAGLPGLEIPRPRIGSFVFDGNGDYLGLAILIFVGIWLIDANLSSSKIGRGIRAVTIDPVVASSFGVAPGRTILHAFVISGAMAGVAGALFGHLLRFVDAGTFSYESVSLPIVAIAAIGGLRGRIGITIAAVAYAALPRLFAPLRGWELIVFAIALIYVVTKDQAGLAGMRSRRKTSYAADGRGPTAEWPTLARREFKEPACQIVLTDVSVKRADLQILDQVSLSVDPGSIVGIVGLNGSGKTTLLNVISGLILPDAGTVFAFGRDLEGLSPSERASIGIGRTFERIGLFPEMTVLDNLLIAQQRALRYSMAAGLSYLPSMRRAEKMARQRANEAAIAAGLGDSVNVSARQLSFGDKRMLELTCVLISDAQLLLLDEPASGLAADGRVALESMLTKARGVRTVVLVEHNRAFVDSVCDRIVVLDSGRLARPSPVGSE